MDRLVKLAQSNYDKEVRKLIAALDTKGDHWITIRAAPQSIFDLKLDLITCRLLRDDLLRPKRMHVFPFTEDAETEDPQAFDGVFRPDSVTFYVRTDNERADAGHFILGESHHPPEPPSAGPMPSW